MHPRKILNIAFPDIPLQNTLSQNLKISKVTAQILINRGIRDIAEAGKFLSAKLDSLLDPFSFSQMQKATNIFRKGAQNKGPVMVCGDYDVDGVTSLALLTGTLLKMKIPVIPYLPHRIKNGYGLNDEAVCIAKEKKAKLLITADCGINNHRQIEELMRVNIDVIVTDHHEPQDSKLPKASAIINPKVLGCGYGYRDLAGVGVAYKFCQAITQSNLFEDLDLVALGTIADVVPLLGENRVIVKEGLSRISRAERLGLKALIKASGIEGKMVTPDFVSFILGPRLNAGGRIDSAEASFKLLMSADEIEAQNLAETVNAYNRRRQKIEGKVMEEACDLINKEVNFAEHKVIVIAKDDWHQGVLGVVASKLADRFYRPAILISKNDPFCKGSGRSIKNFHLFKALTECGDSLDTFGGHSHAVGLVIARENIEVFKNRINALAHEKLRIEDLLPSLDIDMELDLAHIDESMIEELGRLEPFGTANPAPLFYTRNLKVKGEPQVLSKETLKFWVSDGKITYSAIGFGMGSFRESLVCAPAFDLVYTPRIDNWQGARGIILEVEDIFFKP